ncbi:UNVERIFIED_CONTAM: hypothetical protein FKN15_072939 [Acipenser sinensis]
MLLHFILLVLAFTGASALKICSFNIRSFGEAKTAKPEIMDVIVKIISRCDVMLIMEIKDSHSKAMPRLMTQLNSQFNSRKEEYGFTISDRLGRKTYKEQYAFIYRFRPRKTRRERRAAKNEGWQWTESERFQVGAVGEESGGEAAEPAQGSGSVASAQDRPDPELEAMGADFLARSRDFRLEQGRDDVLGRLFDQAAVVNGRVVEPRRAATYPHFEINRDLLYRVDKLPQTGEVRLTPPLYVMSV